MKNLFNFNIVDRGGVFVVEWQLWGTVWAGVFLVWVGAGGWPLWESFVGGYFEWWVLLVWFPSVGFFRVHWLVSVWGGY